MILLPGADILNNTLHQNLGSAGLEHWTEILCFEAKIEVQLVGSIKRHVVRSHDDGIVTEALVWVEVESDDHRLKPVVSRLFPADTQVEVDDHRPQAGGV